MKSIDLIVRRETIEWAIRIIISASVVLPAGGEAWKHGCSPKIKSERDAAAPCWLWVALIRAPCLTLNRFSPPKTALNPPP
jgi:hypothetical protein